MILSQHSWFWQWIECHPLARLFSCLAQVWVGCCWVWVVCRDGREVLGHIWIHWKVRWVSEWNLPYSIYTLGSSLLSFVGRRPYFIGQEHIRLSKSVTSWNYKQVGINRQYYKYCACFINKPLLLSTWPTMCSIFSTAHDWPCVLFLVQFLNNFDQTTGFYWSYTLLLKLLILMHSCIGRSNNSRKRT